MKQNHNAHQNRQGRSNQNHSQKRSPKGRQNRNQQPASANRQVDSRGPAGNQRGNAKQLYEKYLALALEKRATDRLEYESLSQHADHYYRVNAEFAVNETAQQAAREKEIARKTQAEAERRANSLSEEETRAENTPETGTVKKPEKKIRAKAEPKDPKIVPQDNVLPGIDGQAPDANQEPKKRRGRPAKVQQDVGAETAEVEKKIIRRPRKKIILPSAEAGESGSDV